MQLNKADIVTDIGETTWDRGEAIFASGAVLQADMSRDGMRITGRVQGSRRQPYNQSIAIARTHRGMAIEGVCSCPMDFDCKHVAAVLLKVMADEELVLPARPRAQLPVPVPAGNVSAERAERSPAVRIELSQSVAGWLDRLAAASTPVPEQPAAQQRQLLFVLAPENAHPAPDALHVRPVSVRLLKDGGTTDLRNFDIEAFFHNPHQRAKFVTPADTELLTELQRLRRFSGYNATRYGAGTDSQLGQDAASEHVLGLLLASGRLRLAKTNGPVLSVGPVVTATVAWVPVGQGSQKLSFVPTADASPEGPTEAAAREPLPRFDRILFLKRPHYLDSMTGRVGPIDSRLPDKLAAEVAHAPVVSAREAALVKGRMQQELAPEPERLSRETLY